MTVKKILIDRNIEIIQTTTVDAVQTSSLEWGENFHEYEIPGYIQKDYSKTDHKRMKQIECLPAIGKAAEKDLVKLYTYSELEQERHKFDYIRFGDILEQGHIK